MITRGTTPVHSFTLPFLTEEISEIFITYVQNNELILEKDKNNVEMNLETDIVNVSLSQGDTLAFSVFEKAEKNIVRIQVRVLMTNGHAYASNIIKEKVINVLKDGEIKSSEEADVNA